MLAVVTLKTGEQGRLYRLPTERDYQAVCKAQKRLQAILGDWESGGKKGLFPIPDEPTPAGGGSGAGRAFSIQKYGMMQFKDLFTARQNVGLHRLSQHVSAYRESAIVTQSIGLALSRCSEQMSSLVRWRTTVEAVAGTFGRNALPIMWDFIEIVPLDDLMDVVLSLAKKIADGPSISIEAMKRMVYKGLENDSFDAQLAWEAFSQSICGQSEDVQEGINSFREKREPRFKGR